MSSPFERFRRSGEFQEDDPMSQYLKELAMITSEHAKSSQMIADGHYKDLQQWQETASVDQSEPKFSTLLNSAVNTVNAVSSSTTLKVTSIFEVSSRTFEDILSPVDRQLLSKAKDHATFYGPTSATVQNILNGASSRQAQQAMKAALDKMVWQKAQDHATFYGPTSATVQNILNGASSRQAQQAMKAALDKMVWQKAQDHATFYGPTSATVQNILNGASSRQAQQAMKAALDKMVWQKAQDHATFYGPTSATVQNILNGASSRQAQESMKAMIAKLYSGRDTFTSSRSTTDSYGMPNFDDILKGFRSGQSRGSRSQSPPRQHSQGQRQTHDEQRRTEAPRQPQAETSQSKNVDEEIESIVRLAVYGKQGERRRGEAWLLTEDRLVIRRVVNTVRVLRQNAQSESRTITDREIYIRYRRLIEQPKDDTNIDEVLRSFKILQALMGGGPSGKLPF